MTPTLVLTRAPADATRFAEAIGRTVSVPVIISPVFEIVALPVSLDFQPVHIAFTSVNAVKRAEGLDLVKPLAWCVGSRTREVAKAAGFETVDGGGDVERLTQTMLDARPEGSILHLHGRHVRGDLVGRLKRAGLNATGIAGYDQRLLPPTPELTALAESGKMLIFPLFSPRAALMLGQIAPTGPVHVVAMSPAVAEATGGFAVETIVVAEKPTESAMIAATLTRLEALDGIA